jgi:hypothetical protein
MFSRVLLLACLAAHSALRAAPVEIVPQELRGAMQPQVAVSPGGNSLIAEGDRAFSSLLDLQSGRWLTNSTTI